jgi:DNA-binding MarR family transcriptional regulator
MRKSAIDHMIQRWERERPELDSSSLGVLARISRLARMIGADAEKVLKEFGLSDVEFQLLAEIRTAGSPEHRVSPRDLLHPLMVSSGGLTNRVDRLERAGLVERVANPSDRRGILVQLTPQGLELVNEVTTAYLANQNEVLDRGLTHEERDSLAILLRKLLTAMTQQEESSRRAS